MACMVNCHHQLYLPECQHADARPLHDNKMCIGVCLSTTQQRDVCLLVCLLQPLQEHCGAIKALAYDEMVVVDNTIVYIAVDKHTHTP